MDASVWEAIFFLLALKIPLVFLGLVVWRAIRATPDAPGPDETNVRAVVSDTPPAPGSPTRPPSPRRRPAVRPQRRSTQQRPAGTRTLDHR